MFEVFFGIFTIKILKLIDAQKTWKTEKYGKISSKATNHLVQNHIKYITFVIYIFLQVTL